MDTIQWKEAPNQYIGAMRELLPYLEKVTIPPQEVTIPSALHLALKLNQLIDTPFVTIIISDNETGRKVLSEMKHYTGRTRLRISFEYVDNQEQYNFSWKYWKDMHNFHLIKGYFPTFTKDVLLRSTQKSIMVMNCDIQPDDLMDYVDLWRCKSDLDYEGCCIGFKDYHPQSDWDNFKAMFTGMKCWSDYPEWTLYK